MFIFSRSRFQNLENVSRSGKNKRINSHNLTSDESKKGVNAVIGCSVENHKGASPILKTVQ